MPDSPQGGEGGCKPLALCMGGSIPSSGTQKEKKNEIKNKKN